jgi:hypothetical protein
MLRYLPYANPQMLMVIFVLLILAAMALAGGAPECTAATTCSP